jgi:hypothetical protein
VYRYVLHFWNFAGGFGCVVDVACVHVKPQLIFGHSELAEVKWKNLMSPF